MTNEELVSAIQQADKHGAGELLGQLYLQNEGLLRKICRRYEGLCDIDDLLQEAFLALHKAAKAFDADRGLQFATLLTKAVRRRLTRYATENISPVTIPAYMATKCHQYESAWKTLAMELGRGPTAEEIRGATGFSAGQIEDVKSALAARRVVSLDAPITSGDSPDGTTIGECIADPEDAYTDVLEAQREMELRKIWRLCSGVLSDREMQILQLRYAEGKSLSDVAKSMEISAERVRQIEKTAREKLLQRRKRELMHLDEQILARAFHRARIGTDDIPTTGDTELLAVELCERESRVAKKEFKSIKARDRRRFLAKCNPDMKQWITDAEAQGVDIDITRLMHIYQNH